MQKEVGKENRTATDIEVSRGGYMPIAVYIEKYGEELSDVQLGALVRKNYERYQKSIEENKEKWKEEGEQFRKARQALNITQRELAECIGVQSANGGGNMKKAWR